MNEEYFSRCPNCGTVNYPNAYVYRLTDLTLDEWEMIEDYVIRGDCVSGYDFEEVENILERNLGYEEVEICQECGGEVNLYD